jgi:hypothetical protein
MADFSVLAELERVEIKYDFAGPQEVKCLCPYHPDTTPSCQVNVEKGVFFCQVCSAKGDVVSLLAQILTQASLKQGGQPVSRNLVLEELGTRYDMQEVHVVDPEVVERWHADVFEKNPLLTELYKRGLTDDDVKRYKLGYDRALGRVTIPVPNFRGDYVNVRRYLPGAPGPEKMRNQRGRGAARWYPEEQLKYDAVLVTGGEMKAIVAARQLNKHGVGAACVTQAEKLIPPKLMQRLQGKVVYWCMDIDAAGRNANEANLRAAVRIASEQYDFLLPLDANRYPKGDVNDFVASGGDLWEAMQDLVPFRAPVRGSTQAEDTEPERTSLQDSANARFAGKRVVVKAIVQAMGTAPYPIPKDVLVKCDKSEKFCSLCPVSASPDGKFTVHPESSSILSIVDASDGKKREALMGAVGIPRICRVCEIEAETHYNAEDARLVPQLEISSRSVDNRMQPAICLGDGMEMGESYELTGRMHPHPQNQQATLLISAYKPTTDALSTYEAKNLSALTVFRPARWTDEVLRAKLDDVYEDFEQSVTRIKFRRDAHLAMDLAYHSVLTLEAWGALHRGWVEVLIAGDSSQGKSEMSKALVRHYNIGEIVSCKGASKAGLMGGLDKFGGDKWFASWGFFVIHDRRLIVLEELKGLHTNDIGALTDMRSSGIAEIAKIVKRRAHARCRLIALSNCRPDGRTVSSYNYGVDMVKELIGGLEDLRRFDAVLIQSAGEVDSRALQEWTLTVNGAHPRYPGDLCRQLILWAWTRTSQQAELPKEVTKLLQQEATRLSERYAEDIPIVDRGSMRFKLARLSAALAARTFSTRDDDERVLLVRPCHVTYISRWLDEMYSRRAYGYLEFTQSVRTGKELQDEDQLLAIIKNTPYPKDLVASLLRTDRIDAQDFMDWLAYDKREANELVSAFVRKHGFTRDRTGYRKTEPLVAFLKRALATVPERAFVAPGKAKPQQEKY